MREVNDAQLAEDIAQMVIANLARWAGRMPRGTLLAGWLYRDTRYTVRAVIRSEIRRRQCEVTADFMNTDQEDEAPAWERIRPWLDQALDRLSENDRNAMLFRISHHRDLHAVGLAQGIRTEAARERIERLREPHSFQDATNLLRQGLKTSVPNAVETVLKPVQTHPAMPLFPAECLE